jgi:hypothetical protein
MTPLIGAYLFQRYMPFTGDNAQDIMDFLAENSPAYFDGATYVIDGSGNLIITDSTGDHNVWPVELNGAVNSGGGTVGANDWIHNYIKVPMA